MNLKSRSEIVEKELLSLGLRISSDSQKELLRIWNEGDTIVLNTSWLSRYSFDIRDWVSLRGGEFFVCTAFDLESGDVVLEPCAHRVIWVVSNKDKMYSHEILRKSLEENFKNRSIWVLSLLADQEWQKTSCVIAKCRIESGIVVEDVILSN